jgi:hypothetical protein
MAGNVPALIGFTLLFATLAIIALHALEWLDIGTLPRTATTTPAYSERLLIKIQILKSGLGVETFYYFLLLIAFIVFFPESIVLLTSIAILGVFHLVAFQALLGRKRNDWLGKLTNRRVAGVLLFDVVEALILIALVLEFYPLIHEAV